jgi:hypothetical protein
MFSGVWCQLWGNDMTTSYFSADSASQNGEYPSVRGGCKEWWADVVHVVAGCAERTSRCPLQVYQPVHHLWGLTLALAGPSEANFRLRKNGPPRPLMASSCQAKGDCHHLSRRFHLPLPSVYSYASITLAQSFTKSARQRPSGNTINGRGEEKLKKRFCWG